jgi:hypothetical protein
MDMWAAVWYPLVCLIVPLFAFSIGVRKAIGRRDAWECQEPGCNKRFQDGWMVDAAHHPHSHQRSHPDYDTVAGGDIRCVDHHQKQHERGTSLGRRYDRMAREKLKKRDRRTWRWREKNGYR